MVLAVIGVLNAAVGAYYYLRIVVLMYFGKPEGPDRGRGRLADRGGRERLRLSDRSVSGSIRRRYGPGRTPRRGRRWRIRSRTEPLWLSGDRGRAVAG